MTLPDHVVQGLWTQPVRERLAERNALDRLLADIPVGRFGEADDVAAAIAFLCSDDSAYTTGDAIYVTGGQTLP